MTPEYRSSDPDGRTDWRTALGAMLGADSDINALVFVTLMDAAKSAQDDLKAIMAGVKAINAAKQRLRELQCKINRDAAAAAVAEAEGKGIAFSSAGLGGARAYQRVEIPIPDPHSPDGVQLAVVSLVDRKVTSKAQLSAALETIRNGLDSMSEMGEMESLRLQMAMDRYSKMMTTLSNLLKKISDTEQSIVDNLK
jgi:hypothetical protein